MSMSSEIDLFWVTIDLGWIQSLFLSEKFAVLVWLLLYLGFWVWWRLSYCSFFVGGGKYGLHEAGIQIWCFPETRPSLVFLSLSLFFCFSWFSTSNGSARPLTEFETFGLCITQSKLTPLSDFLFFIICLLIAGFAQLDFRVILSLKLERCLSISTR